MTPAERVALRADLAKALDEARTAMISVITKETGMPYGALVNFAPDGRGYPIFLLSNLAKHTQALLSNPHAALLVTGKLPEKGDALTGFRVSLMGTVAITEDADARSRYLERHPYARSYAGFADFSLWKLAPHTLHAVAGFGRIITVAAGEIFPLA